MNKAQIPATAPPRTKTAARTIPGQRRRGASSSGTAERSDTEGPTWVRSSVRSRGAAAEAGGAPSESARGIGSGRGSRAETLSSFLGQGRGSQPFGGIGGDCPLQHRLQRAEYGQRLRGRFAAFGGHDPDTGDGLTEHQRQVIDVLGLLGRRVAPRSRSLLGRRVALRNRSLLGRRVALRNRSLLGRRVALRKPLPARPSCRLSGGRNKSGGQPEVGDVGTGGGVEEDAGGHEAQVGPAGGVDVHQGPGPLQANHERLRRREAVPGAQKRGQASSGEILGDDVGLRV